MEKILTNLHRTCLKAALAAGMLFFFGSQVSAQITTPECLNTYSYCAQDTVTLVPSDVTTYTNFKWYANSVVAANEITAANAASFNVDPNRLGNNTIYVTDGGGTYILTADYVAGSGCATKNDTLNIMFLPTPDLATVDTTICQAAGQDVDLNDLVTDENGTTGAMSWYASLANAEAGSSALSSTVVEPTSTTKYYVRKNTTATDAETEACYDIDSVTVNIGCLNLGNYVWYDTNNNGAIDSGENPIEGVVVELYLDANNNGVVDLAEQTAVASTTTGTGGSAGLYLFENLAEGSYIVGIPSSEFGAGEPLANLYSSGTTMQNAGTTTETTAPDPDAVAGDTDDNGQGVKTGFYTGGVMAAAVELNYGVEPENENPDNSTIADNNDNLTVDFGFYGMSIGNLVFADVNNNATFDSGTESGIADVTVKLYAADGTTVVATTTTDANGQYLFTNLPEGDYIVAVDLTDGELDGLESSTDGPNAGNPNAADDDDNGTVTTTVGEIRTPAITLDAGAAPTGEPEHGDTMGNPAVADNAGTPDGNSNLHADFGFKPECPVLSNASADQNFCAGATGSDITMNIDQNVNVKFVRFTSAQTGSDMYSGGTEIQGSTAPTGSSAPYTGTYTFATADFPNTGTSTITYYVYAILATAPADALCRPFQEIEVAVDPVPTATTAALAACETTLGGGEADFTLTDANSTVLGGQTGMTVTYHATQAHADAGTPAITSPYTSSTGTVYVRVENAQGCYATAAITLTVNANPDFTLALGTVCPGEDPTVNISNLTNGTVGVGQTQMNINGDGNVDYAAGTLTTDDGITVDALNTIVVTNENGCSTSKTITTPDVTPVACPPVNVSVKRAGE